MSLNEAMCIDSSKLEMSYKTGFEFMIQKCAGASFCKSPAEIDQAIQNGVFFIPFTGQQFVDFNQPSSPIYSQVAPLWSIHGQLQPN